jgi:hypothetical protein
MFHQKCAGICQLLSGSTSCVRLILIQQPATALIACLCSCFLCVQLTEEALDRVLATNTKSVAFAFKYQLPAIEKSGGKGSMLVNTPFNAGVAIPLSQQHTHTFSSSTEHTRTCSKYIRDSSSLSYLNVQSRGTSSRACLSTSTHNTLLPHRHIHSHLLEVHRCFS